MHAVCSVGYGLAAGKMSFSLVFVFKFENWNLITKTSKLAVDSANS